MNMRFKPSVLLIISVSVLFALHEVQEADSIYAYAIKGIVKDLRLHPQRFVGGWFFKKALLKAKIKLKIKLKKKLIIKKLLLKKLIFGVGVAKLKLKGTFGGINIFAPKLFLSPAPAYIPVVGGWSPDEFWTHAHLHSFRRKKRAVRFPDEYSSSDSENHGNTANQHPQQQQRFVQLTQSHQNFSPHEYFGKYDVSSLGLSQSDLEQLKSLPTSIRREYERKMEELETAASEPKEEEIDGYLSMASEFDNNGCIPKIICEIMTRWGNFSSSQFESQVLEYYRDQAGLERNKNTPWYIYNYAAHLGRSTRDRQKCASHFASCQDSSQPLSSILDEMFDREACNPFLLTNNIH